MIYAEHCVYKYIQYAQKNIEQTKEKQIQQKI